MTSNRLLSAQEVAHELGLSYSTVRRLLFQGLIPGTRFSERGAWRIAESVINDIKAKAAGKVTQN